MTTPTGGGNSLGTAYGKDRIDYESSGAAKATKDVEALQSSLVQTGSAADKSARQISSAVGSINNFASQTAKLGSNIKNPVEGLAKTVENEIERASKSLAGFKGSINTGDVLLKPSSVRIDKGSLDKAIQDWKASAKKELSIDDVSLGINVTSASLSQSASAAKELAEAFREGLIDGIKQAVEEAGNRAGDGFSDSVDKQTNKARGSGSKLAGAFGGALKTGLGVAAAGVAAATAGVGFVLQQGFSRLQGIDQASAKLKALGLNVNQIAAVSKSALASVQDTAFGMDDAFSAAANAINAGIKPGKELDKYLMALSNTAALAGTSMTDLGDALSDAAIQGKLTGDVVQSLVARQVPVFQLIADEYDTTAIKAQQMVSNSEVSFDRFVDAMSKNTEAARIMGQTITGSWQNMMASIKRIGAALLSPIFGSATGDAGTFALAIQAVTNKLKEVEKWLGDHKNDVIDWWVGFGKAALAAAQVVTGVVSGIVWGLGRLAKIASGIVRLLGKTDTADSLSKFGDDADAASYKIQDFNKTLDKGYGKLDEFGQKAKDAKKPTAELGDAAGDGKEKMISLADALEKLGFKADAVTKAIEGTNKEFKDFIKQLSDKKAPQALIDALTKLHDQYNNGGRQVKAYADAIDQLGDSSVDASTKANSLIDSLKGLNQLPNDDALASYNEQFDKMTDYMSNIIDLSDVMKDGLVDSVTGRINTNSKNGQSLLKAITEIRQSAFELAASGTVAPGDVWDRTAQEMQDVLVRQAGITPEMAAKIMDTYILPKDKFEQQFKDKANPVAAVNDIFKDNPAQLDAALNLLTSTDDLLKQLIPEGSLVIPATVDASGSPSLPTSSTPSITTPSDQQRAPGMPAIPGLGMHWEDGKGWVKDELKVKSGTLPSPDANKNYQAPPEANWLQAQLGLLGDHFRWPNAPGTKTNGMDSPSSLQQEQSLTDVEKEALADPARVAAAWDQMDEVTQIKLRELKAEAENQGKTLAQAYAEGVFSGEPFLREAIKKLATVAADGLGHSPAKYGPLSGKGWSFYRGQSFSKDWAGGIASEADSVKGAVSDTASGAAEAMPIKGSEVWARSLKDLQEFSDLGKHVFDFVKNIADISFSMLKMANDWSGGRLFPKSYVKSTKAKSGSALGNWYPTPTNQPYQVQTQPSGGRVGSYQAPATNYTKDQAAMAIISQAQAMGFSPEQTIAAIGVALQETDLGQNPLTNKRQTQNGTPDIAGMFQQDASYAQYGDKLDPNVAARGFLTEFMKRGAGLNNPNPWAQALLVQRPATVAGGGYDDKSGEYLKGRQIGPATDIYNRLVQNGVPPAVAAQVATPPTSAPSTTTPPATTGKSQWPWMGKPKVGAAPSVSKTDGLVDIGNGFFRDDKNHTVLRLINGKYYNTADLAIGPDGKPILTETGEPKARVDPYTKQTGTTPKPVTPQANTPSTATPAVTTRGTGYGMPTGTNIQYGGTGFPDWVTQLAAQFGLQASTYPGHQDTNRNEKGYAPNPMNLVRGVDFSGTPENMQRFAEYLQSIAPNTPGLEQIIWKNPKTGQRIGMGGAGNITTVAGKDVQNYYPETGEGSYAQHTGHVHTRWSSPLGAPGLLPGQTTSDGQTGLPVVMVGAPANALNTIAGNTDGLPSMPAGLEEIVRGNEILRNAMANQGALTENSVVPVLQELDAEIAKQTALGTDVSKANAQKLSGYKQGLMSQFGLEEGPTGLDQAQTIMNGIAGIASDVFGLIDQGIRTVGATKDIADTLVRGIANTEDVYKAIDDIQEWISLGSRIAQTVSDVTGMVSSIVGAAGSGDTSGGTQAAAMALGAVSGVAGIISQVYSAVNAAIDIGQEVYRMATKYIARGITEWLGLPGAQDINYLLDTVTGQVKAYTSENPLNKTTLNTMDRMLGGRYSERVGATNSFVIYQGPGQDPRDTMSDAMFAVRSSGIGAFGG